MAGDTSNCVGNVDDVVGSFSDIFVVAFAGDGDHWSPGGALTSSMLDIVLSYTEFFGAIKTDGVRGSTSAIGPCFISAAG